ncbi:MAG: PA-phosphatase [Acidobacteria bacterium]|nr:MAG: PA-phosphatase [Acidobacteriota bacterium]
MKYNARTVSQNKNGWLLALVLMTLAIGSMTPYSACAQHAPVSPLNTVAQADVHTDMVLDWNAHAANAVVGVAGQRPERGLIRLAMVQVAIYDAVNAIDGYPFQSYGVTPNVVSPASPEAATAAAAHDMLVALFPAQQADLDAKYSASLATIPDGPARANGISVGQQAALGILGLRASDGRDAVVPYTPGSGPGVWMPTPPAFLPAAAPEAAHVQPFALNSPSQFRAEPPPELTSDTWTRDYNEVKSLGSATSTTRTAEQTDIGRFWSDQPILQWNRAWRNISVVSGLSLSDNARFFAMLATASADAIIACWDSKYFYNFWRPVTAIRGGDTDGNPDTGADFNWIGLVATPNHPEYPAAHGCFSGASTNTLRFFFGTDSFDFTIDSKIAGVTNPVRSFASFSEALDEVLDARVYGGMHYRNSTNKGAKIGKQVSHYVTRHFFQPSRGRGHD